MIYDAIIVGHGPAGITCANNIKRASKAVLAIGKDLGVLSENDIIYNFYGQERPISGPQLIKSGISQALNQGVDIAYDSVVDIEVLDTYFIVKTNHLAYQSKAVLLATGSHKKTLPIKNYHKFSGKGISSCEVCDGFLYKEKRIGIIGKNPYIQKTLDYLSHITTNITLFTEDQLETQYLIVSDPIISFEGDKRLTHVITANNTYEVDGIFLADDAPSSSDLAKKIGIITSEKGQILVSDKMETNINGLFAAGDVIGGEKQIVKSSYDGYKAAISMIKYLKK